MIESIDIITTTKEEIFDAYQTLQEKFNHQQQQIKTLEERIRWFERQIFGVKSERLIPQKSSEQLPLFELSKELELSPPAPTITVAAFERGARTRKSPTAITEEEVLRFGENVPVDVVVIYPKEVEGLSEDSFEVIGEKITDVALF